MDNHANDTESSVGCVMCSTNFDKDEAIVVTSCGHLYHRQCLSKWFTSSLELNGHSTCPDCRTIINDKTGINTIYPHFIEPDNLQSLALVRVENEKRVLVGQLLESKSALMKISMELKKEKIKSTHLTSKVGTLTKKLELADQSCLHCGIEKGTKKAVATKPKTKKIKSDATSGEEVTKNLRSRMYTYRI